MIKRKQLHRHDPAKGVFGDCHRTAIACVLDLEPNQVPHFAETFTDPERCALHEAQWLASRGLWALHVPYRVALEEVLRAQKRLCPRRFYLLGGKSRTGCGHTVVACDDQIIWDPSLDDSGIVAPGEIDGFYWVTWLMPLTAKGSA